MYARMAHGIWRFARSPFPDLDCKDLPERLSQRESNWLSLLRRTVFATPDNPYHQMFRLAGISFEALEELVQKQGLQAALHELDAAGIRLTHNELKGKEPIIRNGQQIPASERSFDNPLVDGVLQTRSSGSRGKGTRTGQSVGYYREVESYYSLTMREFALQGRPFVALWPVLPSDSGLKSCLLFLRQRQRLSRWFAIGGNKATPWHYKLLTLAMVSVARTAGADVPWPEWLAPNDFRAAARHLAAVASTGIPAVVSSYVSPAVRTAAAATDMGLRLDGTLFRVVGEALTPAKRATIEATGARVAPFYWITEIGPIGHSCTHMSDGNHVHIFADAVAVISRPRKAPLAEGYVDALRFTTLSASAPRILINADLDDTGQLAPARCDCVFSHAGFDSTIRGIASVGKVTGQGITLFGTDIVRLLEQELPRRFGGATGDYQLVEVETPTQTEILLRVRPRSADGGQKVLDPEIVKQGFLEELQSCYGGSLAARQWQHMNALRVEIADPIATETGKVLPLQLLQRTE
jgi:hypothetical protein